MHVRSMPSRRAEFSQTDVQAERQTDLKSSRTQSGRQTGGLTERQRRREEKGATEERRLLSSTLLANSAPQIYRLIRGSSQVDVPAKVEAHGKSDVNKKGHDEPGEQCMYRQSQQTKQGRKCSDRIRGQV